MSQKPHRNGRGKQILTGRYEMAAMPDYSIQQIHATLDQSLQNSFLTVKNTCAYERSGKMRLSFDCLIEEKMAGRSACSRRFSAELLDVSDRKLPTVRTQRAYKIATRLVLGNSLVRANLWLTELSIRSTELVIGSDIVGVGYDIDATRAFYLGQPRHKIMALLGVENATTLSDRRSTTVTPLNQPTE